MTPCPHLGVVCDHGHTLVSCTFRVLGPAAVIPHHTEETP